MSSSDGGHTCAIAADDSSLWCWGNGNTRLDPRSSDPALSPIQLDGLPTAVAWADVDASGSHACATTVDRAVWCWGDDTFGELGDGAPNSAFQAPQQLTPGTAWRQVTVGGWHTCGILAPDASAWC